LVSDIPAGDRKLVNLFLRGREAGLGARDLPELNPGGIVEI
jgi:hypothetical protein